MCVICQSFQPWCETCAYPEAEYQSYGDAEVFAASAVYTYDQIATQLTTGFWSSFGGSRAFDVAPGGILYVDTTNLTSGGQAMARQALDAWTVVTGIDFVEVNSSTPPSNTWNETLDAGSGLLTTYLMGVGDDFRGTLSSGADRDAVALILTAGQSVTIELAGDNSSGNATEDPYLWLLDAQGKVLAENDDAIGRDSALTFQASTTGTYFIRAGSFADSHAGDYRISVREEGAIADIVFDDEQSGAYATSLVSGGVIQSSFVNINSSWAGGSARTDGYFFQTYLHEIGHALGLGHAGNYDGSADYASDALYLNDSWQSSVMSYFHQTENTWLDASFAYAISPMMADIVAIQKLYGTPTANAGDTTYGDGSNTGTYLDAALDLSNPVTFTIFDTDGNDTLDFSSYTSHQVLDLREESFSNLAGLTGNVGIARSTIIENGRTGGGNDVLVGNDVDNTLFGGSGADTMSGGSGNDALSGGTGSDVLYGGDGFDLIEGGAGNNRLEGDHGGDLIIGGDVSLAVLTMIYPSWTPPPDAESLVADGDLIALWQGILDSFEFA